MMYCNLRQLCYGSGELPDEMEVDERISNERGLTERGSKTLLPEDWSLVVVISYCRSGVQGVTFYSHFTLVLSKKIVENR